MRHSTCEGPINAALLSLFYTFIGLHYGIILIDVAHMIFAWVSDVRGGQ